MRSAFRHPGTPGVRAGLDEACTALRAEPLSLCELHPRWQRRHSTTGASTVQRPLERSLRAWIT
jgi:hypothetical protein